MTRGSSRAPNRNTAEFFDAWRSAPLRVANPDPRFELRRAGESEFDRIFDLVDEISSINRSRAMFDWLYRRNPRGLARCFIVYEKQTHRLIASNARFPWPINQGANSIEGYLTGDAVVATDWQRRGVLREIWKARSAHPWTPDETRIAWPNPKTRSAYVKNQNTGVAYRLDLRVLPLRWDRPLPLPKPWEAAAQRLANWAFGTWTEFALRSDEGIDVEVVSRFDSSIDRVAREAGHFDGFWCPRDAAFLNWRYLEHPTHQYVAFVASEAQTPVGYGVIRTDGDAARLMELECERREPRASRVLLNHAIRCVREAGCSTIGRFGTPAYPHWALLRRAGFLSVPSELFAAIRGERPDLHNINNCCWAMAMWRRCRAVFSRMFVRKDQAAVVNSRASFGDARCVARLLLA